MVSEFYADRVEERERGKGIERKVKRVKRKDIWWVNSILIVLRGRMITKRERAKVEGREGG